MSGKTVHAEIYLEDWLRAGHLPAELPPGTYYVTEPLDLRKVVSPADAASDYDAGERVEIDVNREAVVATAAEKIDRPGADHEWTVSFDLEDGLALRVHLLRHHHLDLHAS